MKEFLIFRLYGPLASWGDIAVGEVRPSFTYPSKSAILGLVAASLGITRDKDTVHREMAEGYGLAVKTDKTGLPLVDYHTIQVPPSGTGRNRIDYATRRDELCSLPQEKLNTILSRRDYRSESLFTVALWARSSPPYPLIKLSEALQCPVFTLYLGRKSCPLALPMEPQIIQADTLLEALHEAKFSNLKELNYLPGAEKKELYWEEGAASGLLPEHTFERRDVPISRERWQFNIRREYHATYPEED